jgi:hypothetical protein
MTLNKQLLLHIGRGSQRMCLNVRGKPRQDFRAFSAKASGIHEAKQNSRVTNLCELATRSVDAALLPSARFASVAPSSRPRTSAACPLRSDAQLATNRPSPKPMSKIDSAHAASDGVVSVRHFAVGR